VLHVVVQAIFNIIHHILITGKNHMGIRNLNVTKNSENTILIPLVDHEGNKIISEITGKQATIEAHGQDSRAYKKALFDIRQSLTDIQSGKEKDTPAKQANRDVFLTKAVVVGWSDVEDDGVEILFSDENLEALLRDEPHFITQIDKAISDRAKFVKKTTLAA
jgi:preprotein translocase subunit SecD